MQDFVVTASDPDADDWGAVDDLILPNGRKIAPWRKLK